MTDLADYNHSLEEKLSEHNQEAVEKFVKMHETRGSSSAHIKKMLADIKKLAPEINFELEEAREEDVNSLVAAVNSDKIRKNNGEKYSEWSKDTINKTLSNFYISHLDRKELWENTENVKAAPEVKVDPDKIPKPQHIKKAVETADNIRNKAIIFFGWATGARIGELVVTPEDPGYITWEDIKFKDDFMTVKVSESGENTRGKKPEERVIPVKFSRHLMKEYFNTRNPGLDEPVFIKDRNSSRCPRPSCSGKLEERTGYKECSECGYELNHVVEGTEPLTADAVRRVLERVFDEAGIPDTVSRSPHDVFRKSCAIYWAYVGWSEYKLRQYFGWTKNSDAPNHYIEVTQEGLEKAMMEAFGEKYDSGFQEDLLKPVECRECGNGQSPVFSYCRRCGEELSEELKLHNRSGASDAELERERLKAQYQKMQKLAEKMGIKTE